MRHTEEACGCAKKCRGWMWFLGPAETREPDLTAPLSSFAYSGISNTSLAGHLSTVIKQQGSWWQLNHLSHGRKVLLALSNVKTRSELWDSRIRWGEILRATANVIGIAGSWWGRMGSSPPWPQHGPTVYQGLFQGRETDRDDSLASLQLSFPLSVSRNVLP